MIPTDLAPLAPDYHGGSIVNLMQSLGARLGAPDAGYAPLEGFDDARLRAARRVVLLVIDGLGAGLLDALGAGSTLAGLRAGTMTSVFPPTTASAVTTFMTGLAPQQHGLTGWFMHLRELGTVCAILPFVPRCARYPLARGVDLARVLGVRGFSAGLPCRNLALLPAEIADSPFSQALLGGAERRGFANLDDFATTLADVVAGEGDWGYTYAYWSELDSLAHLHGPSSATVAAHFRALDHALAPLPALAARHGTLLLITADHGFVDSGAAERVDVATLPGLSASLSQPLCGEPRTAWCYVRAAAARDFERVAASELGTRAEAVAADELVARGWFGPGPAHPELRHRIGDYALLMHGRHTLRDCVLGERDLDLLGAHGGISAAEQRVPLLVAGP